MDKPLDNITFKRLVSKEASLIMSLGLNHNEFKCMDYEDFWSLEELQKWLNNTSDICVGAFNGCGQLVGYCLTHFHRELNKIHLENIFVAPNFRRRSIASNLVKFVKDEYSKLKKSSFRYVAIVLFENKAATEFFKKNNFDKGEKMLWLQGQF